MVSSEQFVVQKKKRPSQQAQKEKLVENHAKIAKRTNELIQEVACLQQKSHTLLGDLSEGKSLNSLSRELEKSEKCLEKVEYCYQELKKLSLL